MNISKLLKKYKYTKSSYIFYDDNMPSMYFTVLEDDKWQLYFTDNKEVQKVDFLQDISIEQVTCYKDKQTGAYCVSFCSKMSEAISLFYTETMDPTQFKVFTSIASNCKTGTVTPSKVILINQQNHILIYDRNKIELTNGQINSEYPQQDLFFDFKNPTGLTFVNGDQDQLLISYQDQQCIDRRGSIYINLNSLSDQKQILLDNQQPLTNVTIDPLTHQVLYNKHTGLRKLQTKITKTYLKNITSNQVNIIKFEEK